jgi:cytochrome c nitrite reductase small subunit
MKFAEILHKHPKKLLAGGVLVGVVLMSILAAMYAYAEEPEFCGGCHAMEQSFASWSESSHSSVTCSECHLPQETLAVKLAAKTQTGIVDVYHQALRDYSLMPELSAEGSVYLQENCLRCHEPMVAATSLAEENKDCLFCHRELVHEKEVNRQ